MHVEFPRPFAEVRLRSSWFLLAAFLLSLGPAAAVAAADAVPLPPGVILERSLGAAASERFAVELDPSKAWRVRVEQEGIDVVVAAVDPLGREVLEVDGPTGREGVESLVIEPATRGSYTVEVRSEKKGVAAGRYTLRLDALSETTAEDRQRLRTEKALSEAGRLNRVGEDGGREQARAALAEAIGLWHELGEPRREAEALLALGAQLEVSGNTEAAVERYEQAVALRRQLGDRGALAGVLEALGAARLKLGRLADGRVALDEALTLRRELGPASLEATTRNQLCLVLQRAGSWTEAASCYQQALTLAKSTGDVALEARVLNNLGGIDSNRGEPTAALEHFEAALERLRALGDEQGEASTLNNLGALHRGLGELEAALASYDAALTIFRRLGDRYWLARTLNNLGFADLTLGDADRARSVLLEALPLRRELGDRLGEAVTLRNLGRASAKLDQRVQALAFYRRALDLSLELSDRRGAATAEKLLGELESSHDAAAARGHLERALTRFEEIGNRVETAEVLELLSRLDLEGGDAAGALELAKRARELEMAVRNPLGAVRALVARARAERGVGDVASAAKSFREALGELETLQQRLGDPGQRALFLASQRDVYEGHVDLLMELHRRDPAAGHDLEALEASEQARSRALLALLEGVGAGLEHGVSPELRERLRATERRLTAKTQRQLEVFSGKASKEEQRAAEQELYAALGELDRVRAEIRLENPRAVLPSPPKTLDAAAIRELLDPDTVLLEFLLGEERSFLWWVTPSTVESYELPARSVLEAQALKARQEVGDLARARSGARSALEVLGATLFAPVVDRLEDQRLVIVADGALHLVPFAALSLPGAGGEPLVVRHEVVSLPSASALDSQRRERRPERRERSAAATTLAILADPIFNLDDERVERHAASPERGAFGDLVRLPETRREAEAIAALLPSGNRLVELGAAARKSRVVAGELREVRIVHLATHGFVDPKIAELSGLMLSRFDEQGMPLDGFLGLHDVTNLELSAELVVLSGCRTALGKEIRGEGPVGLARGFMYAGVPRVVASLWQVRDRATAELMTRFYRGMLKDGLRPAVALRAAQLSLRTDRRFRDPYYWAAFELEGDWR